MTVFLLQTLLLLAIAYIVGCVLGCLVKQLFFTRDEVVPPVRHADGALINVQPTRGAIGAGVVGAAVAGAAAKPKPEPVVSRFTSTTARQADGAMINVAPTVGAVGVKGDTKAAPEVTAPAEPVAFVAPEPKTQPKPAPKPKAVKAPVAKAEPKPKAAAKPKAAPKPKATAKPKVAAAPVKDDLKLIRGIGRQNEARLNAIGVTTFAQIAAWSKAEQKDIGERLAFPGRIEREEWVSQAAVLAKGGLTEFSKRVAKGEVASSTGKGSIGDMGTEPKNRLKSARNGKADNLTLIDGVGNAIEKRLFELGIFHFDQIAGLTPSEQVWLGSAVGFPGRVEREEWVEEAATLAAGGTTEHAKRVEDGKIASSHKSKGDAKKS